MAQAISNKVSPTSLLGSLSNKKSSFASLSPTGYRPLQSLPSQNQTGPVVMPKGSVSGPNLQGAVSNLNTLNKANPVVSANRAAAPVQNPVAPQADQIEAIRQGLLKVQSQLPNVQAPTVNSSAPAPELTPEEKDKKLFGTGIQGSLIQQALAKQKEASEFNQKVGQAEQDVMSKPQSLNIGIGQASNIAATQGLKAQALTSQAGQLLGAAGQVSPVNQFGQLTNPLTGEPVSGGAYGNNPQLQTAVSQAVELVQNGASPNDPQVQALLSTFGLPGASLFNQALNAVNSGTYNPTQAAASAQTNASLGANTQTQAYNLNLGLQQLKAIQPLAVDFMQKSGINPNNVPVWNENIQSYLAKIGNPADAQKLNAIMTDIQSAGQAIIANKAPGTPTSVVEQQAANDPRNLNWSQLQDVLNTWDTLGQTTLGVLQNQAAATGNTGYSGNKATPPTSITPSTPTPGSISGANAKGFAGGFLNLVGGFENAVKNYGGELLGWIARGI